MHVEIIANERTWETLFISKKDFIDGLNGDNHCRISYHKNFNKVAEGSAGVYLKHSWDNTHR